MNWHGLMLLAQSDRFSDLGGRFQESGSDLTWNHLLLGGMILGAALGIWAIRNTWGCWTVMDDEATVACFESCADCTTWIGPADDCFSGWQWSTISLLQPSCFSNPRNSIRNNLSRHWYPSPVKSRSCVDGCLTTTPSRVVPWLRYAC